MTNRIYSVLFVCTGNSARSIIGEAILNQLGRDNFRAYSAGSTPRGVIHPLTLETLGRMKHDTDTLRSKSWDEFLKPEAPQLDFIFTLCDKAQQEPCPVWPGQPVTAHWGFSDPSAVDGTEQEKRAAFDRTYREMSQRLRIFLCLPLDKIDKMALQTQLNRMGDGTGT